MAAKNYKNNLKSNDEREVAIIETDNVVFSVPWTSGIYFKQNIHFSKPTFLN